MKTWFNPAKLRNRERIQNRDSREKIKRIDSDHLFSGNLRTRRQEKDRIEGDSETQKKE